jgi:CRP-like cAMP-binding protein
VEDVALKEQILARSPFGGLGGAARDALVELGRVEQFSRKQRIVQQGEPPRSVFLVGSGRVKLERVSHGRAFAVGHRGPGELLGEAALAGAAASPENATVLDDLTAFVLPVQGIRKLIASDAATRAVAAAALTARQLETEARLTSLLLLGVEPRLVEFLANAARRWGQPHPSGEIVSAPFTHADIALLIGSTRETVTLLLGKLKRAGLIDFDRRRIVIRDAAGLSRRAAAS